MKGVRQTGGNWILPSVWFTPQVLWVELRLLGKNLKFLWGSLVFGIARMLLYLVAFLNTRWNLNFHGAFGLFLEEWVGSGISTALLKLSAISSGFWRWQSLRGRVIWNTIYLSADLCLEHRVTCSYLKFLLTTWNGPFKPGKRTKRDTIRKKLAEAPKCLRADGVLSSVAKSM